jgi:hypothetical protein
LSLRKYLFCVHYFAHSCLLAKLLTQFQHLQPYEYITLAKYLVHNYVCLFRNRFSAVKSDRRGDRKSQPLKKFISQNFVLIVNYLIFCFNRPDILDCVDFRFSYNKKAWTCSYEWKDYQCQNKQTLYINSQVKYIKLHKLQIIFTNKVKCYILSIHPCFKL